MAYRDCPWQKPTSVTAMVGLPPFNTYTWYMYFKCELNVLLEDIFLLDNYTLGKMIKNVYRMHTYLAWCSNKSLDHLTNCHLPDTLSDIIHTV